MIRGGFSIRELERPRAVKSFMKRKTKKKTCRPVNTQWKTVQTKKQKAQTVG